MAAHLPQAALAAHVHFWRSAGIKAIVSLVYEAIDGAGSAALHLPVSARKAPPMTRLGEACRFIDAGLTAKKMVVVHGIANERTGTAAATWAIAQANAATEAVKRIRAQLPGLIATSG